MLVECHRRGSLCLFLRIKSQFVGTWQRCFFVVEHTRPTYTVEVVASDNSLSDAQPRITTTG